MTNWMLALFALTIGISCTEARAARLLKVVVEQDGRQVLRTYYDDRGTEDAVTVWGYLAGQPIMVAKGTVVAADKDQPRQAHLDGKVRIRILHVDRVIAEAQVDSLQLQRRDPRQALWYLPGAEVRRTAKAAGLK